MATISAFKPSLLATIAVIFILSASLCSAASSCNTNCHVCNTANACEKCDTPYFLYGTDCVVECPQFYYEVTSNSIVSCQQRTYVTFTSSLTLQDDIYILTVEFDTPVTQNFHFSKNIVVFSDNSSLSNLSITQNSEKEFTIKLMELDLEGLNDRTIYIDVSKINNDSTTPFYVNEEASQTNLTIEGIAAEGSSPWTIGVTLGWLTHLMYAIAMILSLVQNIKTGGSNSNLMMVMHYSFLFGFVMMLNIKYAPNLVRYYETLPFRSWTVVNIFKYIINPTDISAGVLIKGATRYAEYAASSLFVENFGMIMTLWLLLFVIWGILKMIEKKFDEKHKDSLFLDKALEFFEWNIFVTVSVGTISAFVIAAFLQLYYLELTNHYSYISFIITITLVCYVLYTLLYLFEVAHKKESTPNWKKLQEKFSVLVEDFADDSVGKSAPFIIYTRAAFLPLILGFSAIYTRAQVVLLLAINLCFFKRMMTQRFFKKLRMVILMRFNEVIFLVILLFFTAIAYNDTYSFLKAKQQLIFAWIIIALNIAHSATLVMYVAYDIFKDSWKKQKKTLPLHISQESAKLTGSKKRDSITEEVTPGFQKPSRPVVEDSIDQKLINDNPDMHIIPEEHGDDDEGSPRLKNLQKEKINDSIIKIPEPEEKTKVSINAQTFEVLSPLRPIKKESQIIDATENDTALPNQRLSPKEKDAITNVTFDLFGQSECNDVVDLRKSNKGKKEEPSEEKEHAIEPEAEGEDKQQGKNEFEEMLEFSPEIGKNVLGEKDSSIIENDYEVNGDTSLLSLISKSKTPEVSM